MARSPLILLVVLAACGAPRPEAREPEPAVAAASAPATSAATTSSASSPRALPPHATFADLAAAARTLDDHRDSESDEGCLIRASSDGYALAADLAVAVRPLPTPAEDLDARLSQTAGPVRVLTRYGGYGGDDAALGLVAIATTLPPTRGVALALFLTSQGVYARRSDAAGGERDASRAAWIVEHTDWSAFDLVAVTAEAATPLRDVVALLEQLPASLAGRITLAVPLAEETRMPEAAAATDPAERAELCPEGLPEPDQSVP
ncbi:MAG: hypothetical protein M3Y87_35405, partial [Myxococcota bacterium]|nr:hypothetical protein [Myxococcota bacterium]